MLPGLVYYARDRRFFLRALIPVVDYFADALLLEGWDNVTNLLQMKSRDILDYGAKATIYAKRRQKAMNNK